MTIRSKGKRLGGFLVNLNSSWLIGPAEVLVVETFGSVFVAIRSILCGHAEPSKEKARDVRLQVEELRVERRVSHLLEKKQGINDTANWEEQQLVWRLFPSACFASGSH